MGLLQVWDVSEGEATKEQVVEGQGHRTDARAMAISNDDSLLISASGDQVCLQCQHLPVMPLPDLTADARAICK